MESQEKIIDKCEAYTKRQLCYERLFHELYGKHWWEWLLGPNRSPDITIDDMIEEDDVIKEDEIKHKIASGMMETREEVEKALETKDFFNPESCNDNNIVNALEKARLYADELRRVMGKKGIPAADELYLQSEFAMEMSEEVDGIYPNILVPIYTTQVEVTRFFFDQIRKTNTFFKNYYLRSLLKDALKLILAAEEEQNFIDLMKSPMWKAMDPNFFRNVLAEDVGKPRKNEKFAKLVADHL